MNKYEPTRRQLCQSFSILLFLVKNWISVFVEHCSQKKVCTEYVCQYLLHYWNHITEKHAEIKLFLHKKLIFPQKLKLRLDSYISLTGNICLQVQYIYADDSYSILTCTCTLTVYNSLQRSVT